MKMQVQIGVGLHEGNILSWNRGLPVVGNFIVSKIHNCFFEILGVDSAGFHDTQVFVQNTSIGAVQDIFCHFVTSGWKTGNSDIPCLVFFFVKNRISFLYFQMPVRLHTEGRAEVRIVIYEQLKALPGISGEAVVSAGAAQIRSETPQHLKAVKDRHLDSICGDQGGLFV